MNSRKVKVVKRSTWNPGDQVTLPHRVIMWEQTGDDARLLGDQVYVTHLEVKNPDSGLGFIWGHYAMTAEAAEKDFTERMDHCNVRLDMERANSFKG